MNGILSNPTAGQGTVVPPAIPIVSYFVAVNGQATGPYNIDVLRQMIAEIAALASLIVMVWKQGMVNWEQANQAPELVPLFPPIVPPIPPEK